MRDKNSPPQPRRGGRDLKKESREATFGGADGVVWSRIPGQHHPVCADHGGFAAFS
jgi:hypothetical protein